MSRIFASDSKPMIILSKILDMIILNILFLVVCIPFVTTGAALCALYYTVVKSIRRDHGYTVREFFHSLKENFWQATAAWLLLCLVSGIAAFGVAMVTIYVRGMIGAVLIAVYLAVILCAVGVAVYLFPVLSRFVVTEKSLFQTSLFLAVQNKGVSIGAILSALLLAGLMLLGWIACPILLFLAPSGIIYLLSFPMEKVLAGCTQENEDSEDSDESEEEEGVEERSEDRKPWYLQKQGRNGGKGDE